jgi:uncharacterized membrane protein YbhN (UPF0104 family)
MKDAWRNIHRYSHAVLLVIAFVVIASYFHAHATELEKLGNLSFIQFLFLILLFALGTITRAFELQFHFSRISVSIKVIEATVLLLFTTILNYLPLNAGMVVRAQILKKYKSLSYTQYVSSMAAISLMTILAAGVLGLLSLGFGLSFRGFDGTKDITESLVIVGLVFLGGIMGPLMVIYIPAGFLRLREGWIKDRFRTLIESWRQLHGSHIIVACCFAILKLLIIASRFWVCFLVLSVETSFLAVILFSSVITLLMFINLTPGGLGVRELLSGVVAEFLGLSFADGLLAAGLERVVGLIYLAVAGAPSTIYLKSLFTRDHHEAEKQQE